MEDNNNFDVVDRSICDFVNNVVDESKDKFNTAKTRLEISDKIIGYLSQFVSDNVIREYSVVCDERNNPPSIIQDNNLSVDVNWKDKIGRYKYITRKFH